MKPKTLWLVRHGLTEWNKERRFQGDSDVPLNDEGFAQAQQLATRFKDERFDVVYSSDLSRAHETAKAISSQPIVADARLREIDFGHWEGLQLAEIEERYPVEWQAWRQRSSPPPDGESIFTVAARVKSVLDEIIEQLEEDQRALVVSHGGTMGTMLCVLFGDSPENVWRYRFFNTGVSEILIFPFGTVLTRLNDISHLTED